jgi:hypothetical protein
VGVLNEAKTSKTVFLVYEQAKLTAIKNNISYGSFEGSGLVVGVLLVVRGI